MVKHWKLENHELEEALREYIAKSDPSIKDAKELDIRADMQAYDLGGGLNIEVVENIKE